VSSVFDDLPLQPPVEPMESRQAAKIPIGEEWQYEPKWDGFRCLVFRSGEHVELESKSGQSLTRYFPELVAAALAVDAGRFVLDGEIYIEVDAGFDFDALLQRIHPAASRVARLAVETPARYAAFDVLVNADGERCYEWPLQRRRVELERLAHSFADGGTFAPSPATTDAGVARRWLAGSTARLDGVIAKRLDAPYAFGSRDAVVKIKRVYTADCVVGGFRRSPNGKIASLLLGLYDGDELDHVGFVGSMSAEQRQRAAELLEPLAGGSGFSGAAPGGPSRWRKDPQSAEWVPVDPAIVVEITFDHVTARRFRHASKLIRWRPDKAPTQCTIEQLLQPQDTTDRQSR
jgi:ATP-dependent DNA ligase